MVKSTEAEIAVLQNQVGDIKVSLETIKTDMHSNFTIITAKIDNLANTPLEISVMNERITALEHSKNREWIRNTASAVAGAVLSALIIYAVVKK